MVTNYYLVQSNYFVIFLIISALAFAALPAMKKAFRETDDTIVISLMNRAQSEILLYDLDHGSYKNACLDPEVTISMNKVLLQGNRAVSCITRPDNTQMLMYTVLQSGNYYCVDSDIFTGIVDKMPQPYLCKI